MRGLRVSLCLLLLSATVVACGKTDDAAKEGAAGSAGGSRAAKSGMTYGYGPVRDSSVKYQPDVVLVEGGPDVIRSASGDGVRWTIDAEAKGASDLEVGKVMYLTSRAVGRVAAIRPAGGDLEVTLAPVDLTDVFHDAHFKSDRDIDPGALLFQEIPDLPGALSDPTSSAKEILDPNGRPLNFRGQAPPAAGDRTTPAEKVVETAPIRFVVQPRGVLPPGTARGVTVGVGDWEARPYRGGGRLGLKVSYGAASAAAGSSGRAGLKFSVDFSMTVNKLHLRTDVPISGGRIGSGSTFMVEGIKDFGISVSSGAANGADDNAKVRVEVPVEFTFPVPGEPLVFTTAFKFIVQTGLGGKNTTLVGAGRWALEGGFGLQGGKFVTPTLSVVQSIMDSITGLSIGTSGVVFASEVKFQYGIGIPAAFAGPYSKLVVSLGFTNGSALGAPLARCVGATLDGKVGGGFGVSLSSQASKVLEKLLPRGSKVGVDIERLVPFYHGSQTLPAVPLCIGAAPG